MNTNMNTLIEHKCVISIASQIIAGAQEEQAEARRSEAEENKQEIQMQNLEGVRSSGAEMNVQTSINTASKAAASSDRLVE